MSDAFWSSDAANAYGPFAASIPSDVVAYALVNRILTPEGKRVLDFGCFEGSSTKRIRNCGAAYVLGVDKTRARIETAQQARDSHNMQFQHVPEDASIQTDIPFDAAAMTFVHPTINIYDELRNCFRKIAAVTRPGASLVVLGLAPSSFSPQHRFRFYGHNKKMPNSDTEPFQNELHGQDEQVLRFTDYYWENRTLIKLIEAAGFRPPQVIPITESIRPRLKETLDSMLVELRSIRWKDEWTAPLYQIIHAKRW